MEDKKVIEKKLLDAIDKYRLQLLDDKKVSATKFYHMQTALFGCKCLVHDIFGTPRKGEIALVK